MQLVRNCVAAERYAEGVGSSISVHQEPSRPRNSPAPATVGSTCCCWVWVSVERARPRTRAPFPRLTFAIVARTALVTTKRPSARQRRPQRRGAPTRSTWADVDRSNARVHARHESLTALECRLIVLRWRPPSCSLATALSLLHGPRRPFAISLARFIRERASARTARRVALPVPMQDRLRPFTL